MKREVVKKITLKTDAGNFDIEFTFWSEEVSSSCYDLYTRIVLPQTTAHELNDAFVNYSEYLCGEKLTERWRPSQFRIYEFKELPTVEQFQKATNDYIEDVGRKLVRIANANYTLSTRLNQAINGN